MPYNQEYTSELPITRIKPFYPGVWGVDGQENTIEPNDGICTYCDWCGRELSNNDICDHCGAPAGRKEHHSAEDMPKAIWGGSPIGLSVNAEEEYHECFIYGGGTEAEFFRLRTQQFEEEEKKEKGW